ncbi:MAG: ATP-dependent zinc metalloprotease FtsH [Desulfobacterales bacterium]
MQKQHKFSIWYLLIAIWGVLLLQNLLFSVFAVETIPYSRFLELLGEGRIKDVAITSNQIQGHFQDSEGGRLFRTVRVDPEISALLEQHNVQFSGEIESTFFRDLLSWIIPIFLFFGIWAFMMKRIGGQQAGFMTLGKSKAKIYKEEGVGVTFEDAAGVDEAKQELVEIVDFLKEPEKFTRLGGKVPRGILLVGPPGTGKTLLARAVAGEAGVTFFSLSGSEFVEMFVGLGAARVRDLFEQAKKQAPCIIFIDELDALGKARGFGGVGGHDEREQTLNQLLVEMDGFDPQVGVILMAATNRPEILDPALLRPGRFDRQVLVDRPDKAGREAILKVHLKKVKLADDVDPQKLAAMTPGMTGADLANLVNEAALLAVRHDRQAVGMAEFTEAVERIVAGLEKKNRLINPKEKEIVAYHEMGHAIVALSLPGTDPVEKISIIPRGIAALGYTIQLPTEDRFLMKKSELLNRIATMMGGRAAEEIVFGDVSTGAQNDILRATDTAMSMVREYGMSEKLGHVNLARQNAVFLVGRPPERGGEYSDTTARLVDEEVRSVIAGQYEVAKGILERHRTVLDEGAKLLLEREKISGKELRELMAKRRTGDTVPA